VERSQDLKIILFLRQNNPEKKAGNPIPNAAFRQKLHPISFPFHAKKMPPGGEEQRIFRPSTDN